MKDYYQILGISPAASLAEIKKVYRALAHKYHPDKNPDSSLSEAYFKDIAEAYSILSDTTKRSAYDDERWLSGVGKKTNYAEVVTPSWLVKVCAELNESLAGMDTHRMSQNALQAYILLILTDAHLGILLKENDKEANAEIIAQLVKATKKLQVKYLDDIERRLIILANGDEQMLHAIDIHMDERIRVARQEMLLPYFIIFVTIALCIGMYFYGGWR